MCHEICLTEYTMRTKLCLANWIWIELHKQSGQVKLIQRLLIEKLGDDVQTHLATFHNTMLGLGWWIFLCANRPSQMIWKTCNANIQFYLINSKGICTLTVIAVGWFNCSSKFYYCASFTNPYKAYYCNYSFNYFFSSLSFFIFLVIPRL